MTRGSVTALPGSLVPEFSIPFCESDSGLLGLTRKSFKKTHLESYVENQSYSRTNSEDGEEVLLVELHYRQAVGFQVRDDESDARKQFPKVELHPALRDHNSGRRLPARCLVPINSIFFPINNTRGACATKEALCSLNSCRFLPAALCSSQWPRWMTRRFVLTSYQPWRKPTRTRP